MVLVDPRVALAEDVREAVARQDDHSRGLQRRRRHLLRLGRAEDLPRADGEVVEHRLAPVEGDGRRARDEQPPRRPAVLPGLPHQRRVDEHGRARLAEARLVHERVDRRAARAEGRRVDLVRHGLKGPVGADEAAVLREQRREEGRVAATARRRRAGGGCGGAEKATADATDTDGRGGGDGRCACSGRGDGCWSVLGRVLFLLSFHLLLLLGGIVATEEAARDELLHRLVLFGVGAAEIDAGSVAGRHARCGRRRRRRPPARRTRSDSRRCGSLFRGSAPGRHTAWIHSRRALLE